ncbi:MAG TPA: FAD-dependent monooxygenase, partial [Acidimicrobiales bacterium]|nr:FAD-dependent monooxygenase [Acidimicrobiales bacterium]
RTIEVLDQRGVADRFLAEGQAMQVQGFATIPLDISDFPTRHNYGLALWQRDFERILAGWTDELGVPVARSTEVTGFEQDDEGVGVELADGRTLRTRFLVGCDGGRSVVRKAAGIGFPGWDPSVRSLIAEVQVAQEPVLGIQRDSAGTHGIGRLPDGHVRVVVREHDALAAGEPTLDDLRRALVAVWGTDFGVHSPRWISRFTDMTRQAEHYRKGRVLLAGDAAHVHYPVGGQGLNIGVQDAVNLGWKLGQVVNGVSPDGLLDTYHAERHPVAARVLQNTMAQTALSRGDDRMDALRESVTELLAMDEPRKRFGAMISGLDVHYDLGDGHPLVGRRMPDLDLHTADGPTRVFELLHDARPLLLDFGRSRAPADASWPAQVDYVAARDGGTWELPVVGAVAAPAAVVIRPDGHVAWAGDLADPDLPPTLARWFGPAPASAD